MFLQLPPETPAVERLYRDDHDDLGFVMNLSRLWGWRPDVCDAFVAARSVLLGPTTLSARDPNATTQADVLELRAADLSDLEIFEATALVAFRHAFSMINDALGAQPDWQLADAAPAQVREAITRGRPVAPRV